ncbi:MAG: hypothetical protein R2710_14735 [Acidimicrobiales bacterium]
MSEVRETRLPGVGVRHEFDTEAGDRVGVVVHRDGRREIVTYDRVDPDACSSLLVLSSSDTRTMADLLGASQVTEAVTAMRHDIKGLSIEWIEVLASSPAAGISIAQAYRARTGASIVAVPARRPDRSCSRTRLRARGLRWSPWPSGRATGWRPRALLLDDAGRSLGAGSVIVAAGSAEAALAFVGDRRHGTRSWPSWLAWPNGSGSPPPLYLLAVWRSVKVTRPTRRERIVHFARRRDRCALAALHPGLEYSDVELREGLRTGIGTGIVDMLANARSPVSPSDCCSAGHRSRRRCSAVPPGSARRVWSRRCSSTWGRIGYRETPAVLNVLVIEDLAMAVYLPVVAALIVGGTLLATPRAWRSPCSW